MPHRAAPARRSRAAFTLVEILIVVVILGVLASIVVPMFRNATDAARRSVFVADLRIFAGAVELYHQENGEYPEDSGSGALPTGWGPYVDEDKWTQPTPLGGVWDMERESFEITSAFGVHFDGTAQTRDDEYMLEVDRIKDDADLATGGFRKLAGANDRYYMIMAP